MRPRTQSATDPSPGRNPSGAEPRTSADESAPYDLRVDEQVGAAGVGACLQRKHGLVDDRADRGEVPRRDWFDQKNKAIALAMVLL